MEQRGQFRLLTLHFGLFQLGTAVAGGFIGAHLLKQGFTLAQALAAFACLFLFRSALRLACLRLVRRLDSRKALILGTCAAALQFAPIIAADDPRWLLVWVASAAFAEALYWPLYHAAAAVTGGGASRGREIGFRTAVGASVSVLGPLLGGLLFSKFGPAAAFCVAGASAALSILPLGLMGSIETGPVPTLRETATMTDRSGFMTFAADGLVASGLAVAWPMVLFISIGANYEAFGIAGALAGLAGAASGLVCGRAIDQGSRSRFVPVVCCALGLGIVVRLLADWSPALATVANTTGAVVMGFYVPILISTLYDRAKASGQAYRFHLSAEAGWDCGAASGCVAAAALAALGATPALTVLPALLGVLALYRTLCPKSAGAATAGAS